MPTLSIASLHLGVDVIAECRALAPETRCFKTMLGLPFALKLKSSTCTSKPGPLGMESKASKANALMRLVAKVHPATTPFRAKKGPSTIPPKVMNLAHE
eukprot:1724499-Pyramimonas_sp.AAC.1